MTPGQAMTFNGEIRFVAAVAIVQYRAECAVLDGSRGGESDRSHRNYGLASELPSVSLFDYWDPATAVQRVLSGACSGSDVRQHEWRFP